MSDVAQACADLAAWLPAVRALTTQPDTTAAAAHGKPGSRPPWNSQAANALFDVHAGARDLEQDLRYHVTGRLRLRGGSDLNTIRALEAVARLAEATDRALADAAARQLGRWLIVFLQLPAVDLEQPWRTIPGPCPRCTRPMLRYRERDYGMPPQLVCLGCARQASIAEGTVSAGYVLWQDGVIT